MGVAVSYVRGSWISGFADGIWFRDFSKRDAGCSEDLSLCFCEICGVGCFSLVSGARMRWVWMRERGGSVRSGMDD